MTENADGMTLSLLQPESRGGDIAEGGFSFQEQIVLSRIPLWLSQDGFTAMTRESIGDAEAKFFVPGHGFVVELVEAKDHPLTPSDFWSEVKRFQEVDAGSPGTYSWFIIASAGLSRSLRPLVNGLRRVRDAYGFYEDGAAVKDSSFGDYVQIVRRLDHDEQDARFLFEKVLIEAELSAARSHGEALFRQSLITHLREYQDLSSRTLGTIYANLGTFVRGRRNQPVFRRELEAKLREEIDPGQLPPLRPISIYTSTRDEGDLKTPDLRFNWATFFGGETRAFPPPERWNRQLFGDLQETRDWIIRHRATRRIRLKGNRRLSASLAVGSVFSAVAGFTIEVDYRGETWSTAAHPIPTTPPYPLVLKAAGDRGEHLVVSVGILKDIAPEVESNLEPHGLADMPRLHMMGKGAIRSPEHANVVVRAIKDSISKALAHAGSEQIDLFFAGPAFLALFLGHRLNATAPVQCYEWVATGHYVPTCRLFLSTTESDQRSY